MQTATAPEQQDAAEARSRKTFGQSFDTLNDNQQRAILLLLELPARLEAMNQEKRHCMNCGRLSSLRQCMDCREGISDSYRPRLHSVV